MPEVKYSLLQRVKMAVDFIRNAPIRTESKKTPFSTLINLGNTPQYSLTDYDNIYREGYATNSLIYSAVIYKAKSITQAKLTAYHYTDKLGNFEKLEWGNDLQRLLDQPNPYQSGDEFHSLQNIFFNLTGNAFTYFERKGKNIVSLWPLNPAYITIIPDTKGEILGYEYRPTYSGGQAFPIERENMAHWKLPNPSDPLNGLGFGMSPIMAIARVADVDNMITKFLNIFFKNGAMPVGLLKFKDIALDENEINRIREKWKETYGGFENWNDVGIMDMYGEYQRIGLTFNELDFDKLDHRAETRILAALGVPLELIATVSGLTGSTYNNKSEARQMFWQDTMIYELEVVEQELGRFFNNTDTNVFISWDKSEVYGLKGDIQKQVDSALKLYQMGMPPRIVYQTVGLSVTDYEGIDDAKKMADPNLRFQQPNNLNNGDSTGSNTNPDTNTANQDENSADKALFENERLLETKTESSFDLETKRKIYDSFDSMIVSHEPEFIEASNKMFKTDEKEILSLVGQIKAKSLELKASINWLDAYQPISNYFNGQSKDNWRKTFAPLIQVVYEDTGNFWGTQLGLQFDIRNIEGELALGEYTLKFSDFIAQTNSDEIKAILQIGYSEGFTIETMTNELQDLFGNWEKYRSERIARTETTRAANDGAVKLYKLWGMEQKEWLSTNDDRTRDTHLEMNGQIVDINKDFESPSGAKLSQPGDSNAPLAETVNCRCTVLPVIKRG